MVKGTYHRQDENICQHGCPLYAQQPQGQRHCWDRKAPNSVILLSEHISRRNESEKHTIFEPSFLKEILPLATLPSEIKLRYVCTATAWDMMSYNSAVSRRPSTSRENAYIRWTSMRRSRRIETRRIRSNVGRSLKCGFNLKQTTIGSRTTHGVEETEDLEVHGSAMWYTKK